MSKKEFHTFLKDYYLFLKKMKINLQPHVHLSMFPENLKNSVKEKMILEARNFFIKDLNIEPKEIVFGWYASDKFSRKIAESFGMKVINEHLHIYDWWMK